MNATGRVTLSLLALGTALVSGESGTVLQIAVYRGEMEQ
jgi:hypothetical protein